MTIAHLAVGMQVSYLTMLQPNIAVSCGAAVHFTMYFAMPNYALRLSTVRYSHNFGSIEITRWAVRQYWRPQAPTLNQCQKLATF